MGVVRKKLFYLSSRVRQPSETIQQFSVMFPDNLMNVAQNETLRLTMTFFSLINSFQNINANNNQFGITYVYTPTAGVKTTITRTLTLNNGSYTIAQIAANVTSLLNSVYGTYTTFTVSIPNQATNCGVWSWVDKVGYTTNSVTINFTSLMVNSAANMLGFYVNYANGNVISQSYTITNGYTTLKNMFSGQMPYIRLHCNIPPINIEFDTNNNMLNYSDILAQIAILVPPYYPITFQEFAGDNNTFQMPASGMKLGLIQFYLTNEYNTPVIITDDYDFVLKIEVITNDNLEALTKEQINLQKLLLIGNQN
jgi:hypothetical protein